MLEAQITRKTLPDGTLLLEDLSLSLKPGETVALLGASGTGKTSLLRILLGLDHDFTGQISNRAQRMTALFQEPRLLPWMNLQANLRLVCPHKSPAQIAIALEEVGLAGRGHQLPRQISLGMARRAALARALLPGPDLLILDEPFASLDADSANRMADLITAHARIHNTAVLMSLHDVPMAQARADRLMVLSGRPARLVLHRSNHTATKMSHFNQS